MARERGHLTLSQKYDSVTRSFDHHAELSVPSWLLDLVGVDFFDTVNTVILDNQEVDDLDPIIDLRSLRSFAIMIE